jgi:hypothetical protein
MTPTAENLPWASQGSLPASPSKAAEHDDSPVPIHYRQRLRLGSTRSTMTEVWLRAALWLGLALAATLVRIGEREG